MELMEIVKYCKLKAFINIKLQETVFLLGRFIFMTTDHEQFTKIPNPQHAQYYLGKYWEPSLEPCCLEKNSKLQDSPVLQSCC